MLWVGWMGFNAGSALTASAAAASALLNTQVLPLPASVTVVALLGL
jgi:Amt family ammonium transporter